MVLACCFVHGDEFMPRECASRHPSEKLKTFSSPAENTLRAAIHSARCKIDALNSTVYESLESFSAGNDQIILIQGP